MIQCCVSDLRDKRVINSETACVIGSVCDVEVDTCSGKVVNIVIYEKTGLFSLLRKDEPIKICWDDIKVIGDEAILVCSRINPREHPKRKGLFEGLFR